MKTGSKLYSLPQSFKFAFGGIFYALRFERNLRIHFCAGALVLYFSRYYEFSRVEYALLLLVIGFVITCELFNTAIEKTVDLKTPAYNPIAKIAKDVAAGAVLVSSIFSVIVSFFLFWDIPTLEIIWLDILRDWPVWALLTLLASLWILIPLWHGNQVESETRKRHAPQKNNRNSGN